MNLKKGIEDLLKKANEEEVKEKVEFDADDDELDEKEEVEEVEEKVEVKDEPELDTLDKQMDFLVKDEDEAIKGYEKVLPLLDDDHIKEQLEKILEEEKAHKEFLEKVKTDHELVYKEPLKEE